MTQLSHVCTGHQSILLSAAADNRHWEKHKMYVKDSIRINKSEYLTILEPALASWLSFILLNKDGQHYHIKTLRILLEPDFYHGATCKQPNVWPGSEQRATHPLECLVSFLRAKLGARARACLWGNGQSTVSVLRLSIPAGKMVSECWEAEGARRESLLRPRRLGSWMSGAADWAEASATDTMASHFNIN